MKTRLTTPEQEGNISGPPAFFNVTLAPVSPSWANTHTVPRCKYLDSGTVWVVFDSVVQHTGYETMTMRFPVSWVFWSMWGVQGGNTCSSKGQHRPTITLNTDRTAKEWPWLAKSWPQYNQGCFTTRRKAKSSSMFHRLWQLVTAQHKLVQIPITVTQYGLKPLNLKLHVLTQPNCLFKSNMMEHRAKRKEKRRAAVWYLRTALQNTNTQLKCYLLQRIPRPLCEHAVPTNRKQELCDLAPSLLRPRLRLTWA